MPQLHREGWKKEVSWDPPPQKDLETCLKVEVGAMGKYYGISFEVDLFLYGVTYESINNCNH
jgi:hypothetical protein